MQKNEGLIDRIIRGVVGSALIIAGTVVAAGNPGAAAAGWPWILIVVGLVLLITSILGFCLLYRLLRINTFPKVKYNREAPPDRVWSYTNTDMVDARVRNWGRSEGRASRYRSEPSGSRHEWGTGSEGRAASNRTGYRMGLDKKR